MKKILVVGSLTHDLFLQPRRETILQKDEMDFLAFCLGDKIRISERHETFGGGAANVAVGLSRFGGISSAVLGAIGDDESAEKILKNLKSEKVSAHFIQKKSGGSGFSVILSSKNGERTVLFCPGKNADLVDFDEKILDDFDGVALQHTSSGAKKIIEKIAAHFSKKPKKFLSWNPGRESLEKGISAFSDFLKNVHFLLLNREEAELFSGEKKLDAIFRAFFQNGFSGNLVVTDGRRGAVGGDGKHLFSCPILEKSPRVDALGAGDAFLSGAVGAILRGENLPTAMKCATINAAAVVTKFGAQTGLLPRENIKNQISKLFVHQKPFSFFSK